MPGRDQLPVVVGEFFTGTELVDRIHVLIVGARCHWWRAAQATCGPATPLPRAVRRRLCCLVAGTGPAVSVAIEAVGIGGGIDEEDLAGDVVAVEIVDDR